MPAFPNIVVDPSDNSIRLKSIWDNNGNLKDTEFETTINGNIVKYDETKSLNTILSEMDIYKIKFQFLKVLKMKKRNIINF